MKLGPPPGPWQSGHRKDRDLLDLLGQYDIGRLPRFIGIVLQHGFIFAPCGRGAGPAFGILRHSSISSAFDFEIIASYGQHHPVKTQLHVNLSSVKWAQKIKGSRLAFCTFNVPQLEQPLSFL